MIKAILDVQGPLCGLTTVYMTHTGYDWTYPDPYDTYGLDSSIGGSGMSVNMNVRDKNWWPNVSTPHEAVHITNHEGSLTTKFADQTMKPTPLDGRSRRVGF